MTTRPHISGTLTTSSNSTLTTLSSSPLSPATQAILVPPAGPTSLSQDLADAVCLTQTTSPSLLFTFCLAASFSSFRSRIQCRLLRGVSLELLTQSFVSISTSYLDSYLILITFCSNILYLFACFVHWNVRSRKRGIIAVLYCILHCIPAPHTAFDT